MKIILASLKKTIMDALCRLGIKTGDAVIEMGFSVKWKLLDSGMGVTFSQKREEHNKLQYQRDNILVWLTRIFRDS